MTAPPFPSPPRWETVNFVSHWYPNGSYLRDGAVRDRGRCPANVRLIFRLSRVPPTMRPKNLKPVTALFLRLGLPSTFIRHENGAFRRRNSNRRNWKTPLGLCAFVCTDTKNFKNEAFRLKMTRLQLSLLYSWTFTQQSEHCDWLILGHVSLIKFKCIPTRIQSRSCCPHVEFCYMIV